MGTRASRRRALRRLQVSVTDGRGRPQAAAGLARWLARTAPDGAHGAVTIALVSDATMRRLNRVFRAADYATDVLSFPTEPFRPVRVAGRLTARPPARRPAPAGRGRPPLLPSLGDIAIATGVARRQARAARHAIAVELRILALHGLLHLLGYDHDADRGQMRRLEERLLEQARLPAGLIARVPDRTTRR